MLPRRQLSTPATADPEARHHPMADFYRRAPMALTWTFIVRRESDPAFQEVQTISSIESLIALTDGLMHELVLSRDLSKDHPMILICDGVPE